MKHTLKTSVKARPSGARCRGPQAFAILPGPSQGLRSIIEGAIIAPALQHQSGRCGTLRR
ncbi:MAG: hypothetical protein ACREFP_03475 [Acetobacteraceae bacterium]